MNSEPESPPDMEDIGLIDQGEASQNSETDTDLASTKTPSRMSAYRGRQNNLQALSSQSDTEASGTTISGSPPHDPGEEYPTSEALAGFSSPPRLRRAGLNRHRDRPRQLSGAGLLDIPQPSLLSRQVGLEEEVSITTVSRANTAPTSQADFAGTSASCISHPEDLIHIPTFSSEQTQCLPDINTINRINAEISWGAPRPSPSPVPVCLRPGERASTWPAEDPTGSSSRSHESTASEGHDAVPSESGQSHDTAEIQDSRQTHDSQEYPSYSHARQDSGDLGYCACKAVMYRHATTVEEGRCVICKLPLPPPPRYC